MRGSGMPTISERRAGHPCGKKILHVSCRMVLMGANLFRMLPFAARFASLDGRGERLPTMVRATCTQSRSLRHFHASPHVRAARLRRHSACFARRRGPTLGTSALPTASGSSSGAAVPWPSKTPASPQFRYDGDSRDIDFPTDPAMDARQGWRRLASDKNAEHQECRLHDLRIEMVGNVGMNRQAAGAGALPAWIEKPRLDLPAGATFMPLTAVVSGKIRVWGAVAESRINGVSCNA